MRNGDRTSLTPKDNGSGGCDGDMLAASPPARPPRERPLRKPVALKDSPNSVARAARGWENDAPVVPLGMRHYPPKYCKMAGLMGGGVNGSSNASLQDEVCRIYQFRFHGSSRSSRIEALPSIPRTGQMSCPHILFILRL